MKLLATIKSVRLLRKYARPDGTFANVFGITIEAGDDTILAETFLSYEGQKKRGIISGAIGTAILSLNLKEWLDKSGENRQMQVIRITGFQLANQNINVATEQAAHDGDDVTAMMAEAVQEEEAQKAAEVKEGNLPF